MVSSSPSRRPRAPATPIPAYFLYGEPPRVPDEGSVHVETIAERSRHHDWQIRPHRHSGLNQVLVIQRGRVAIALDERKVSLRAPGLVVVPPDVVHAFAFEENTGGFVVSFAAGLTRSLSTRADNLHVVLNQPAVIALSRAAFRATELVTIGELLMREFGRSATGRDSTLRGLLAALLGNVARIFVAQQNDASGGGTPGRELVARFRQSIEHGYRRHVSIAAYARGLDVSGARLRRACLAATGLPPIALVLQRMLVEAERQLRYTTLPVSAIAYYLGFDDPAYFSRFFSHRSGRSPRVFRRPVHLQPW